MSDYVRVPRNVLLAVTNYPEIRAYIGAELHDALLAASEQEDQGGAPPVGASSVPDAELTKAAAAPELPEEVVQAMNEVLWFAKKIGGETDSGEPWADMFRRDVKELARLAVKCEREGK